MHDSEKINADGYVLVVVTNQYMLLQLMWYYNYYPEGRWHAIVTKVGSSALQKSLYEECLRLNIFDKVFVENSVKDYSCVHKMLFFLKVFSYYFTGRKKAFSNKMINEITGGDYHYDKFILINNNSFISCACMNVSEVGKGVMLQDGMLDYIKKDNYAKMTLFEKITSIFSKIGCMNWASLHSMKLDRNFIKYVTFPNRLKYTNYYKIKEMDFNKIGLNNLMNKHYSEQAKLLQEDYNCDVILFSTCFHEAFGKETADNVYETLHSYLLENYKENRILIKRHPRETFDYSWDDLELDVIFENIAAEFILEKFHNKKIILLFTSTILLELQYMDIDYDIIKFNCISNKSYKRNIKHDLEMLSLNESILINI